LLISFLTPLTLTDAPDATVTYNGTTQSGASTAISGVLGAAATGSNAGFYNGYYSTQQGYDITGGNLTIDPAVATLSGTRNYDGTTIVAGSMLTATGVDGQTLSVTGAGDSSNLASKNVQTDSALATITGLALGSSTNGGLASNYTFSTAGSSITITPAPLTISAVTDTKTYDGTSTSVQTPTVTGLFSGDALSTLTQSFASKNVLGTNGSTLNVNGFTLSDGNNGGNYTVTVQSATGTITQLASVAWVGGATGNWSAANNWAGGAIPDYANVAAVTIPKGTTVTYDSGVVGATTLSALTDGGNFIMASGSLSTTGSFATAGYEQTGGALDVGGALTVRSTGGGVTLGDITAGSLSVTSLGGAITQLASTSLDVTGGSTLKANNGLGGTKAVSYSITLANAANNFVGAVSSYGSNINLADGSSGLRLGNTTATGTLTDTSSGGAITQAASTAINVTGATSLTADNGASGAGDVKYSITLNQDGNNFGGAVTSNGLNVNLLDADASGLILGNTTATGTLIATSTDGAITQLAATSVDVTGTTKLTADNGQSGGSAVDYGITLANAGNDFGRAVTSTGSNIDLVQSTGGLILGNTTATGTLTADSTAGAITQSASTAVNVSGATSLTASNGGAVNYNVTLAQAGNSFAGTVTADGSAITLKDAAALTAVLDSSGASTLTSVGAMNVSGTVGTALKTTTTGSSATTTFGATTVGTNLTVTSTGAVTETSANILEIDGKGTTTVKNAHVCINGTCNVEITAP
jgi:hypothetical protein